MGMLDYHRPKSRAAVVAGRTPHWLARSKRKNYITAILLSMPPWVTGAELRAVQARARCLTEMTGVLHTCDHIVPVNHPRVCGLTVPWNLQVLTEKANQAKSNHWVSDWHEQMEMFT